MKVLKCKCGYQSMKELYNLNHFCDYNNPSPEVIYLEKVYVLLDGNFTAEQWNSIVYDASQFDGGLKDCQIVDLSEYISKTIQNLDEAEEIYDKIIREIKIWKKRTNHIEIYGKIPVPIRYLMFDNQNLNKFVIVNEPFGGYWLPTGKFYY